MKNLNKASFRSKANYWAAVASEVAGLPLFRRKPSPPALGGWRRGVLLGADHIGDVLYTVASLPTLARATPQCAWTFAASSPADQVLETNPHLRGGVLRLPSASEKTGWRQLVPRLREGRFDVAICYDTGSYLRTALAAAAAGIPERIGYVHKGFSWLPTRPIGIDYPSPFPCYFRDLVHQLTGQAPPEEPRPRIYPTAEDEAAAASLFTARGFGGNRAILACSIFTRMPVGVYPPRYFIETLRRVQERREVDLVFLGSAGDRPTLQRLLEGSGLRHHVIAGDLSLRASYCFLRRCHAAFATDSGVRHLANAADIPVVFPRNLYSSKIETGKYCATETDIAPERERVDFDRLRQSEPAFDPEMAAREICRLLA